MISAIGIFSVVFKSCDESSSSAFIIFLLDVVTITEMQDPEFCAFRELFQGSSRFNFVKVHDNDHNNDNQQCDHQSDDTVCFKIWLFWYFIKNIWLILQWYLPSLLRVCMWDYEAIECRIINSYVPSCSRLKYCRMVFLLFSFYTLQTIMNVSESFVGLELWGKTFQCENSFGSGKKYKSVLS